MIPGNWRDLIWTRRDGTEIALVDMDIAHIKNAIALLMEWRRDCRKTGRQPTARELSTALTIFNKELKARGLKQAWRKPHDNDTRKKHPLSSA